MSVVEQGLFTSFNLFGIAEALVHLFVAENPTVELSFTLYRAFFGYCPVNLLNVTVTEHGVEPLECLACLGKNYDAAYRAVETVWQSDKNVAGLCVFLFE